MVEPIPEQVADATDDHVDPLPPVRPGLRSSTWRRRVSRADLILALGLLLCYGFFRQHPLWNEFSRYDLVQAIVETGSPIIDADHENTGDKAFYDGHYYSDKAPGTALLGVPVQLVVNAGYALAGAGSPVPDASMQALSFAVSGIPTVVLVLLLLGFLRPAVGPTWALAIALGYGLGSMAFPFATMFFGHAASTAFLFASFYLVWRWRSHRLDRRLVAAGAFAGLAVITEIPVVLGVVVVGIYALWVARRRALLYVLGGLPLLAVLLAYNTIAFDNPFSLGYQYATVFAEQNSQGILSIVFPTMETAGQILVGPRGLLTSAPWFALAPLGLLAVRSRLRSEVLVSGAIVALFVTYNSGALNPLGGWTPGPRYLMPALPFAAILVALAPRLVRPLTLVLVAISIAIVGLATVTMPNAAESVAFPLTDLWLPRFLSGDLAETNAWVRFGLHGHQPLLVLGFGVLLAILGVVATRWSDERGLRRSAVVVAAQVALIVGLAAPLPPVTPFGTSVAASHPSAPVVVIDAGVSRLPDGEPDATGGRPTRRAIFWAQMVNPGRALVGTRVTFTLAAVDGTGLWSGWYDEIDWVSGERKQMRVPWTGDEVGPGVYRVAVAITTPDGKTYYGRADQAATLTIG